MVTSINLTKAKKRRILLLEPNYKNKYPPIGLMKISTYHRMLGDKVTFYKGDLNSFLLRMKVEECLKALRRLDKRNILSRQSANIEQYIKTKHLKFLNDIIQAFPKYRAEQIEKILRYHAFNIPKTLWDRIYVTTLFTFYWDTTIKTIEFAKKLVDDSNKVFVGGVMASLLNKEITETTGIKPFSGLLNTPGLLDIDNKIIVDDLHLDYSILEEIEYKYPTQSAYFTYMTKGCTRKCSFCSVPKLEPTYTEKIPALSLFQKVKEQFGDQRNLMLMDNNVLASPKFPEIIEEIKLMGFTNDSVFIEQNQLEIAVRNLKNGINDKAYVKRALSLIYDLKRRLRGKTLHDYEQLLIASGLISGETVGKKAIIKGYKLISAHYERYRSKKPNKRYVDFNQGVDARYVTEENMFLMSQIPIKPLRIAFDHIGIKNTYVKAVELAAKNGIKDLSNYILYNFEDKPIHFYERLLINVSLGKRLGVTIFSFPMKFVPLFGEEAKDRKYVGKHWNRKYLRAIQCILNTTKGIVAPGYDFFKMSFGESFEEFMDILIMPEGYIINRIHFEKNGMKYKWKEDYQSLSIEEKEEANKLILANDFRNVNELSNNVKILRLLSHYTSPSRNKSRIDADVKKLRNKFNALIRKNIFVDLTLTHDFENRRIITAA